MFLHLRALRVPGGEACVPWTHEYSSYHKLVYIAASRTIIEKNSMAERPQQAHGASPA